MNSIGIKEMNYRQLNALCEEMCEKIIAYCAKNGGYLSGSLSAVEIMTAISRILPEEDMICLVGNDAYAWNILHSENGDLSVCGYNTSLAQAYGKARLRDLENGKQNVLVYINDSDLKDPENLEMLREIADYDKRLIIVCNERCDDRRRLSLLRKGVSVLSNSLPYNTLKKGIKNAIRPIRNGEDIIESIHKVKGNLKKNILSEGVFEQFNIDYIGPVDGHSLPDICFALNSALTKEFPVVIHCVSVLNRKLPSKYSRAARNEWTDHFDPETGRSLIDENQALLHSPNIVSLTLNKLMDEDPDIVVLSPSSRYGESFWLVRSAYPDRFISSDLSLSNTLEYAFGMAEKRKVFVVLDYSKLNGCITALRKAESAVKGCLVIAAVMDEEPESAVFDLLKGLDVYLCGDGASIADTLSYSFRKEGPQMLMYPDAYLQYNASKDKENTGIQGKWRPIVNNEVKKRCIIAEGTDVPVIRDLIIRNGLKYDLYDACIVNPLDEDTLELILKEYREVFVYNSISRDRIKKYASRGRYRASVKCFDKEEINSLWQ